MIPTETFATMTRQQRRFYKRKLRDAATRFDKHGCAGCGAPWTEVEVIVATAAGSFAVCCPACAKLSGRPVVALGASGSDAVTHGALDRDWFAANPASDWRVRDALPGEVHTLAERERLMSAAATGEDAPAVRPDIADPQILAVQIEPGKRLRAVVERGSTVTGDMVNEIKRRAHASDDTVQRWAATAAPLAAIDRVLGGGAAGGLMATAQAQGQARHATKH
jgi:hypothetical protein